MKIIQIIIVIAFILYIISYFINMMENHSVQSKQQFKEDRNWKITIAVLIFIFLYLAGTFKLIFSIINF